MLLQTVYCTSHSFEVKRCDKRNSLVPLSFVSHKSHVICHVIKKKHTNLCVVVFLNDLLSIQVLYTT